MQCLYCEAMIPERGARFCSHCGTPIVRCPSCEEQVLADAPFCGHCGEDLRPHGISEASDVILSRVTRPVMHRSLEHIFLDALSEEHVGVLYRPTRIAQRYPLKPGDNVIGANPRSDIHIADPEISWNHALVICHASRVLLQDTASTNGTALNGVPIARPMPIEPGDVIRLAQMDFTIWLSPSYKKRFEGNP